jgi:hypothetical protein
LLKKGGLRDNGDKRNSLAELLENPIISRSNSIHDSREHIGQEFAPP